MIRFTNSVVAVANLIRSEKPHSKSEAAMKKRRQSDADSSVEFTRSNSRTFNRDNYWYFSSREGDMGPYDTEAEAIEEMEAYVGLIDLREENEAPVTPDLPEDEEFVLGRD